MDATRRDLGPLAVRQWAISQSMTRFLLRRNVPPNAISLIGLASGCVAGLAFGATASTATWAPALWLLGAILILIRLFANVLDGMVAVEGGQCSRVGELFNEIPDRISDSAVLIGLGYAAGGHVALGYIAALAAVFTAYVRAVGKAV